jgi:DNA-binding response OmpR family regulator
MQVLVADDDPVYRNMLKGLLEEWHFDVRFAVDGDEAWAILQQPDAPELVILDWKMPKMDGYEVCRLIREARGSDVPYVLLMTVQTKREDLLKILVAGVDDYLLKPFEPLDLKIRLRTAIRILDLQKAVAADV